MHQELGTSSLQDIYGRWSKGFDEIIFHESKITHGLLNLNIFNFQIPNEKNPVFLDVIWIKRCIVRIPACLAAGSRFDSTRLEFIKLIFGCIWSVFFLKKCLWFGQVICQCCSSGCSVLPRDDIDYISFIFDLESPRNINHRTSQTKKKWLKVQKMCSYSAFMFSLLTPPWTFLICEPEHAAEARHLYLNYFLSAWPFTLLSSADSAFFPIHLRLSSSSCADMATSLPAFSVRMPSACLPSVFPGVSS